MAGTTFLKEFKKGFERDLIVALSQLGKEAILDAYGQAGFQNRTYNLHDSYASAVYVGGVLVKDSVEYLGNPMSRKLDPVTKKNGRQTVDDYLERVSFGKKNNEIILIVVAAMFYAGILEAEWGATGSPFRSKNRSRKATGKADRIAVINPARQYIKLHYDETVASVYAKYGIKTKPKTRVVKGEKIKYAHKS